MFTGHIDILRRVEVVFDEETLGKTFTEMPVPEQYKERVEAARHEVIEAAVEHDEELLEKYLGGAELSYEEIQRAIRKATVTGAIVPVLCGASFKNKGVQALLDAVIDYLPSPVDIPAIRATSRCTTTPTSSVAPPTRSRSPRSRSRSQPIPTSAG